jgi:spermidine synthase
VRAADRAALTLYDRRGEEALRLNTARIALIAAGLGGLSAVAAEVVFTRRLALEFGVTAPAAATVVAVYMAGMALGSALGGKWADKLAARAGVLYAAAELFALIWALCFLPMADALGGLLAGLDTGNIMIPAGLGALVLVGPPAIASGATFPALTRLVGDEGQLRALIGANAGGAAAGALLAGLWLPSLLGYSGTLWAAGVGSALAGGLMLAVSKGKGPDLYTPLAAPIEPVSWRTAAAVYAALGAAGMAAEIGWTRLLEQTGPNPGALTFPLVLAAYLVGLGIGGAVLEPRLRSKGERTALGICVLISGGATLGALALLPLIPPEQIMGHAIGEGPGNTLIFKITGLQVSFDRLAIYLGASAFAGMASGAGFPIAASSLARERQGLGTGVGLVWSAGTVAAVLSSLWMGFLPGWGPGTVRTMAIAGVVVLGAGLLLDRRPWRIGLVVAGALTLLVRPWAGLQIPHGETVLAFLETAAGPSAVTLQQGTSVQGPTGPSQHGNRPATIHAPDQAQGLRWIYTHGERVPGFALSLEIPLSLHPSPDRVVLIAFGTGVNTPLMLSDPRVGQLTVVDIDRSLPSLAAEIPGVGADLFDGERGRFVNDDGRHFLRASDAEYDIIYSDVATYAQYVELGTTEFFELCRDRLAPGGMFVLKVHTDTLSVEGQERFLATVLEVFDHVLLVDSHGPMPVLVAWEDPPERAGFLAAEASSRETYGDDVRSRVEGYLVLDHAALSQTLAAGRPSRDDRPMRMSTALVGPYNDGAYDRSGQDAFFAAIDEAGRPLGEVVWGLQGVQATESIRPTNPPQPPRRVGWIRNALIGLGLADDPSQPAAAPPPGGPGGPGGAGGPGGPPPGPPQ